MNREEEKADIKLRNMMRKIAVYQLQENNLDHIRGVKQVKEKIEQVKFVKDTKKDLSL